MHLQEEIYLAELLAVYGEMLTERQQEVMQMYFHQNQSLAEIADCFGITVDELLGHIAGDETEVS